MSEIFLWTKCGHEYDKECVRKYIDQCFEIKRLTLRIPICKYPRCNQELDLCYDKALEFGLDNIQFKQFKKLKSISLKTNNITKNNKNDCIVM